MMTELPDALKPLEPYDQFILWIKTERNGKQVKLPVNWQTLEVANAHNPAIQTSADNIFNIINLLDGQYGVGFVITKNDPFYFCDVDKCLQPDGNWSPVANDILSRLPGAAVEISQSGQGLHIIGTGIVPEHSCKNTDLGLEFYTQDRFVALTGTNATGDASTDNSLTTPAIVNQYFPPKVTIRGKEWRHEPVPEWNGYTDDNKLIEAALNSGSAASKFGGTAAFSDLWKNNIPVLSECYPDLYGQREYDPSNADASLAQHLAFWTGCNHERIFLLMWSSNLVRDKWNRDDYLIRTITRACQLQETVYTAGGRKKEPPRGPVDAASNPLGNIDEPEIVTGYQFLGVTQQIEHFKRCTYVSDIHRVLIPTGSLLRPDQFNVTYGGFVFQLDSDGSGKTTKKAWEAFTESQVVRYPKAESTCFRPELPPGEIVNENGHTLVNTYTPIETPRVRGDITPFLTHLEKVLPDPRDQTILLSYMAACIQHKGVKFQWAPLLQGCEGNGKTLFTRCVEFAIGKRYTHMPPASEISEKFNDWLFNVLFIGVEDIYVPDHKREVIEIIKPMITNDRLAKRAMQQGQVMHDVRCNFLFNSNHKDAIQKTQNDRRFAVFYTAQQDHSDIKRDGMDGQYFPKLYNWLKADGYAMVADYLENYAIPDELNPAVDCHRAPITSSTTEALTASLGVAEQLIQEAIDLDERGFNGDLICTKIASELLKNNGKKLSPQKVVDVLSNLGYIKHPALSGSDGKISINGTRRRIYVKRGSLTAQLPTPDAVAEAWKKLQVLTCPSFGSVHV